MADIVDLRSRQPTSHDDEFNSELVRDLARFSEGGLITEKEIRRRYRFDDAVWESLADNEALIAAIEDEKTRRVRNGQQKRERSQKLVTQAPNVLGEILCSKDANPRHRIDAARALDDFSVDKPEAAAAADRFHIVINLGSDTLTFDKSIRPLSPGETDPDDIGPDTDSMPHLAALTVKKVTESGGGQEHL
jgi:hypothetical protein